MTKTSSYFPNLGFGCGLRHEHHETLLKEPPATIDWVEAIAENFADWTDGRKLSGMEDLEKIRSHYPVVVHGVSLSIGSVDPLDLNHLRRVKTLLERVDAAWFSDHLCWTGVDGKNLHDLLPLPYTEEAVVRVSEKIQRVQDFLGRRILIENVSSYLSFSHSEMSEWDFINEILRRSDCGILLDVNNIYVSSVNHGFDPLQYLKAIPPQRIGQIHLAGHTNNGDHLIDTHDEPVCDAVWDLYRWVTSELGTFSTMVEWDDQIPPWSGLETEVAKARQIGEQDAGGHRVARDTSGASAPL